MTTRAIDKNGDWVFGKGGKSYKTGIEEIKQNIATKILEWKGDCFFDTEAGIDWLNILGTKNNTDLLRNQLLQVLSTVEEVLEIQELQFNLQNRIFNISFSVKTTLGNFSDEVIIRNNG